MKGLYGFVSACALIMTIALIPEYVGIIPGAMIFLCGGLFAHLINKILEEEQRAGGESPQDPLASRSWDWIDPGLLPGSQMLEFANLFHQIGFLQTLVRRPGLNTGSFFLRTGSQVTDQVAKIHPARRTRTHEVAKIVGWWLCVWGNANKQLKCAIFIYPCLSCGLCNIV